MRASGGNVRGGTNVGSARGCIAVGYKWLVCWYSVSAWLLVSVRPPILPPFLVAIIAVNGVALFAEFQGVIVVAIVVTVMVHEKSPYRSRGV